MNMYRHNRRRRAELLIPGALLVMLASSGAYAADEPAAPAAAPPAVAAAAPLPVPEAPPAKDWSVGVSADLVSRYVWRGILINEDPVVQPSATLTWKGLSLNVWQSWDTTDQLNHRGKVQETDYTLSYSKTVLDGKLTLSGGAILYTFPDAGVFNTTELFAAATVNTLLSPTIAVYKDIDESRGLYINPSISHTITINDKANVVLKASVGWGDAKNNGFYLGSAGGEVADYGLSAQLNYSVTSAFVVSPYIKFSDFIDGDIRTARSAGSSNGKSEQLVVGISAAYTF